MNEMFPTGEDISETSLRQLRRPNWDLQTLGDLLQTTWQLHCLEAAGKSRWSLDSCGERCHRTQTSSVRRHKITDRTTSSQLLETTWRLIGDLKVSNQSPLRLFPQQLPQDSKVVSETSLRLLQDQQRLESPTGLQVGEIGPSGKQ